MDLQQLDTTLIGIENALLRRKCDQLESSFNELDDIAEAIEEAYEIEGQAVDTSAATGGTPPEEAYAGYDVGREGERHMDGGATKNSEGERARAHAKAMQDGPDDRGRAQTTAAQETRAHSASSTSREDRGDIDHGHA